jgi:hypothetical protein
LKQSSISLIFFKFLTSLQHFKIKFKQHPILLVLEYLFKKSFKKLDDSQMKPIPGGNANLVKRKKQIKKSKLATTVAVMQNKATLLNGSALNAAPEIKEKRATPGETSSPNK